MCSLIRKAIKRLSDSICYRDWPKFNTVYGSLYIFHGVCCSWCMLCMVYAVHSMPFTLSVSSMVELAADH